MARQNEGPSPLTTDTRKATRSYKQTVNEDLADVTGSEKLEWQGAALTAEKGSVSITDGDKNEMKTERARYKRNAKRNGAKLAKGNRGKPEFSATENWRLAQKETSSPSQIERVGAFNDPNTARSNVGSETHENQGPLTEFMLPEYGVSGAEGAPSELQQQ